MISWKPAPGATGYDVILWRDGRRLRDLWPRGARAPIAETWTRHGRRQRLRPGRYLWFVYPLTKRRGKQSAGKLRAYGALVVARGAAPCTERARVESTVAD